MNKKNEYQYEIDMTASNMQKISFFLFSVLSFYCQFFSLRYASNSHANVLGVSTVAAVFCLNMLFVLSLEKKFHLHSLVAHNYYNLAQTPSRSQKRREKKSTDNEQRASNSIASMVYQYSWHRKYYFSSVFHVHTKPQPNAHTNTQKLNKLAKFYCTIRIISITIEQLNWCGIFSHSIECIAIASMDSFSTAIS